LKRIHDLCDHTATGSFLDLSKSRFVADKLNTVHQVEPFKQWLCLHSKLSQKEPPFCSNSVGRSAWRSTYGLGDVVRHPAHSGWPARHLLYWFSGACRRNHRSTTSTPSVDPFPTTHRVSDNDW